MHPHIILDSVARSGSMENTPDPPDFLQRFDNAESTASSPDEFLAYTKTLLDRPRRSSSLGLLSPTDPTTPGIQYAIMDDHVSMKEIIDHAIVSSNSASSSKRNPARFQIQRGGHRVAVIKLARPMYRLGETVIAVIDFCGAEISCCFLRASLETSETIEPPIALRSAASVNRATRRTYADWAECVIHSDRAIFTSMIPISATPEFKTSGVSLAWKLRFEFITGLDRERLTPRFLRQDKDDDRGTISSAVQDIPCESFEVSVPIRVYGAAGGAEHQRVASECPI